MAFGLTKNVECLERMVSTERSRSIEPESRDNYMYFVYILRTSQNTLYIGQTNNLRRRLEQHKNHKTKSAKYIRYFDSFKLVYSEECPTRKEAMQREVQLKRWSRAKKEALIKGDKIALKKS